MPFKLDGKVFTTIGSITDIIILNLLFLLCCIPIVTIGAAQSALYYTTLKIVQEDNSQITKNFFHSFKTNLKQGTVIHLILLLFGAFIIFDLSIVLQLFSQNGLMKVLFCVFFCIALIYLFIYTYIYPILAQFANTTKNTFKNAFILSISNLPFTIIMVIINFLPLALFIIWPNAFMSLIPLYVFAGFGTTAYINSLFFKRIFKKHLPDETHPEDAI